jgi:hypothetical protein
VQLNVTDLHINTDGDPALEVSWQELMALRAFDLVYFYPDEGMFCTNYRRKEIMAFLNSRRSQSTLRGEK